MNTLQRDFLMRAAAEAVRANLAFPTMAACEAALESSWGNSELASEDSNLFGMKQHAHPVYGTINLPTREWQNGPDGHAVDGRWITVAAKWVKYPDWRACFADRLATLERLSNAYPHYAAALKAQDAETYIAEVSKSWSTDPQRAAKVLSIYREYTTPPVGASSPAAT
jgi:flagellum-specific peptidoglycan hydrolase FlgJ